MLKQNKNKVLKKDPVPALFFFQLLPSKAVESKGKVTRKYILKSLLQTLFIHYSFLYVIKFEKKVNKQKNKIRLATLLYP